MRTTIRIDDQLLAEVKQLAARTGRTTSALIEDSLRETLARRQQTEKPQRVQLIVDGHGGLQPGVNLDRASNLLDLMDELPADRRH